MSSSFGNRSHRQLRVPERLRPRSSSSSSPPSSKPSSFSLDSEMEDIIYNHPSLSSSKALSLDQPSLMFSDGLDSADYFDLPSPPSTPMNPTHFGSLNDSILSSGGGPPSPGLSTSSVSSCSTFSTPSSPGMSGGSSGLHWPTVSQRINRLQLRSRSFSASSSSTSSPSHSRSGSISSAGSAAGQDALVSGMQGLSVQPTAATIRAARRTPYYPPNSSRTREAERQRVYMNRGPHYVPNWTPLGSLPRHVQLQIEERMDRFTAI